MTSSLILQVVARWVCPVMYGLTAILFLKGHNSPGGGFIAGLLAAAAILLHFLAFGRSASRIRSTWFVRVVAAGLAIGVGSAIMPVLLGYPFFKQTFGHVHLPLLGDVELASASLFDLGVFVVVVGTVITVISAMTED